MTQKVWIDGEVLYAADLNNNFISSGKVLAVYTSTAFDSTYSGSGTQTNSYEFADISAASLGNADYLVVSILDYMSLDHADGSCSISLKIETKDLGGSYADSFPLTALLSNVHTNNVLETTRGVFSFFWVHTLTSNEKANGIKVKITSSSTSNNAGNTVTFTNKQTIISGLS
jgi:hypothetical protein